MTIKKIKQNRKRIDKLESDLKKQQTELETLYHKATKLEIPFFQEQEGCCYKSTSGKRYFRILEYRYINLPCFIVDFFDTHNKREISNKLISCYSLFHHDFDVTEITEQEYYSKLIH